jgi:hypothetical protein
VEPYRARLTPLPRHCRARFVSPPERPMPLPRAASTFAPPIMEARRWLRA